MRHDKVWLPETVMPGSCPIGPTLLFQTSPWVGTNGAF